jgi:surface protein
LKVAVAELLALDPTGATPHPVHGPISEWNVSQVRSMLQLFLNASEFNQPLNSWNVSNVEDMQSMFFNATSFNQPLDAWEDKVSNVKNMQSMFYEARSFNQDLCGWKLRATVEMADMFEGATAFNNDPETRPPGCPGVFVGHARLEMAVIELLALDPTGATPHPVHGPIGGWDVSRVTDMKYLFAHATAFNQPLNGWDVSNVQNMSGMFYLAQSFNQPLDRWDVSNVEYMPFMFSRATSFNQDLCGWKLGATVYMADMFEGATAFNNDPETRPPG